MQRIMMSFATVCAFAGAAEAQFPGQPSPGYVSPYPPINPANVMPNIFNPANQPLSPYLNMFRNGNPSANYYFGVRPGTIGGAGGGGSSTPFLATGGNRPAFFPQLAASAEPFALPTAQEGMVLPPAGHPVLYGNTMGYFPSPMAPGSGARPRR